MMHINTTNTRSACLISHYRDCSSGNVADHMPSIAPSQQCQSTDGSETYK